MKGDAESEVHRGQNDGPFELMEQEIDQASMKSTSWMTGAIRRSSEKELTNRS